MQRAAARLALMVGQRLLHVAQALPAKRQVAQSITEAALKKTVKLLNGRQRILGQTLPRKGGQVIDEDAQQAPRFAAKPAKATRAFDAVIQGGLQLLLTLLGF